MYLTKLIKSLLFIFAVSSVTFSASYGMIDGHRITGKGKAEYNYLCNAVIAVNYLKSRRACQYISNDEYAIKVKIILASLKAKGLIVR